MAEERVVVEIELGVEREQPTVGARDERIDFDQRSIGLEKGTVQASKELDGRVDLLRLEAKREGNFARLKWLQTHARINVLLENLLRRVGGDLLNIHAACR